MLDIGDMETWDGADLARLRDLFTRLIHVQKPTAIGIKMSHVTSIPSGFFGMLFDWYEAGVQIRLYSAQPNVQRMLWFTHFFEAVSDDCHELCPRSLRTLKDPLAGPKGKSAKSGSNGFVPDTVR
jgi:hypothetical protein